MAILKLTVVIIIGACWYASGLLNILIGALLWTLIWGGICGVHNFFTPDSLDWSYLGFWKALNSGCTDWKSIQWSEVMHYAAVTAISGLCALLGSLSETSKTEATAQGEQATPPGQS